jgi:hypothetical protein
MNQGTRWVLLMQKNRRRKSHAWAPLKEEENPNSADERKRRKNTLVPHKRNHMF